MSLNMNPRIEELWTRTVAEIIDEKHLRKQLDSGRKLRVKLGIDPTSPNLHIGRAVVLWKLRQFQELGHQVVFIVGDFTGLVGDTSDKDSERPMMSLAEVKSNMKTYAEQAFKILDRKKTEIHYNSEWLAKLGFVEIAKMASLFGLHEFESREIVAKRLKAGKRVSFHEMMYPLMQGYDSVAIKADVELGGTDQRFNLLAGRIIQPTYGQEPQDIVMMNLLEGTDGRKMSSSWGNVINLTDEPNDMFGKTMTINDKLIVKYFEYATRLPMGEIEKYVKELKAGVNPSHIKKRLARELVTMYHGKKAADAAQKEFEKVFSKKEKPTSMPQMKVKSQNIVDLLVETKMAPSKSEARRLVQQKAVKYNDEVIDEWDTMIDLRDGAVLQSGKRKFIKLKK
ncbi:MAG: tyrosine--tRNA ligase [Candidatus Doudnabacteria bacterium]|nr:tyrosine--tRNA ligase [Candidatus Doudnabacteria bacterium]